MTAKGNNVHRMVRSDRIGYTGQGEGYYRKRKKMIFLEIANRKSLFPFAVALQPFLDHSLSSETLFLLLQKKLNLPLSSLSACLNQSYISIQISFIFSFPTSSLIPTPLIMYKFPPLKLVMAIECYYCCNLKNIKCVQANY